MPKLANKLKKMASDKIQLDKARALQFFQQEKGLISATASVFLEDAAKNGFYAVSYLQLVCYVDQELEKNGKLRPDNRNFNYAFDQKMKEYLISEGFSIDNGTVSWHTDK